MFERYTEKARRVIFFARYEASALGSPRLEAQHLLLGIARESKAIFSPPRFPSDFGEALKKRIEAETVIREEVSTSVDLPLANEVKRMLAYAAEEAEGLSHHHLGTEHLLLGILREPASFAAKLLAENGLTADVYRVEIQEAEKSGKPLDVPQSPRATLARGDWGLARSPLPLSADGFRVLAFAIEEAAAFGKAAVGPEHLLLGILRREKIFPASWLEANGIDAEALRRELRQAH
jgi:ATP-dependent Clp protease ATP-binding subunit ClpA